VRVEFPSGNRQIYSFQGSHSSQPFDFFSNCQVFGFYVRFLKERNNWFALASNPHSLCYDSSRSNRDDQNAEKQSGQKVGLHATFADKIKPC
jgi:hypothetical protein